MLIIWSFSRNIMGCTKCPHGPHAACMFETPAAY